MVYGDAERVSMERQKSGDLFAEILTGATKLPHTYVEHFPGKVVLFSSESKVAEEKLAKFHNSDGMVFTFGTAFGVRVAVVLEDGDFLVTPAGQHKLAGEWFEICMEDGRMVVERTDEVETALQAELAWRMAAKSNGLILN